METRREMTAAKLKWIAVITMLIDHFGASIIEGFMFRAIHPWPQWIVMVDVFVVRAIGRIAFPIFIFLMVEGLYHTRNRLKYWGRLVLLAFISEVPFDMAIFMTKSDFENFRFFKWFHQNVFFTLSIGLLMMILLEYVRPRSRFFALDREVAEREGVEIPTEAWYMTVLRLLLCVAIMGGLAYLNHILRADYGASGVVAFAFMYWMNVWLRKPWLTMLAGVGALCVFCSVTEFPAAVDALIVRRYRGAKGKSMNKWFFYFVYPAHLLIYGCICMLFF